MYTTAGYILDPALMNKADAESPGHRKDLLYCISYRYIIIYPCAKALSTQINQLFLCMIKKRPSKLTPWKILEMESAPKMDRNRGNRHLC